MTEENRQPPSESGSSPEVSGPSAEYICRVVAGYSAAQALALNRETGIDRRAFCQESLDGLKTPQLQEMIRNVAAFWETDQAKTVEANFVANGQVGETTILIADEGLRADLAGIVRAGTSDVLDTAYANRLKALIGEADAKINISRAIDQDASEIRRVRDFFAHERRAAASSGIIFSGKVRSLFESDFGQQAKLGRSHLTQIMAAACQANRNYAAKRESGVSAELAISKAVAEEVSELDEASRGTLRYGTAEEDAMGGDVVYERNGWIFFIDAKSSKPRGKGPNEKYETEAAIRKNHGRDYKFTVWPPEQAEISEDFKIEGDEFKQTVRDLLDEANRLSEHTRKRIARVPTRAIRNGH